MKPVWTLRICVCVTRDNSTFVVLAATRIQRHDLGENSIVSPYPQKPASFVRSI